MNYKGFIKKIIQRKTNGLELLQPTVRYAQT